MKKVVCGSLAIAMLVTGCAGRDPAPISAYSAYDSGLSCDQMTAEQLQNTTKITQLEEENSNATAANIAIGAVGLLLFWPALFALNTSDAPDVEIRALKERNANLDSMKFGGKCGKPEVADVNGVKPVGYTYALPSTPQ